MEGRPQWDEGSLSYAAAIESAAGRDTDPKPSAFHLRVRCEAGRRQILWDGARWTWNVAFEMYPAAIQIVDLFRAKETLWEAARVIGADAAWVKARAEARCEDLEQGRLDGLVTTPGSHDASCEHARKCADYIERNRMRYRAFHRAGLCVGSGVLEAGCKPAVERSRMRGDVHLRF